MFDDLYTGLNDLLQTGSGSEEMKPDSLHGMEHCPPHDFSGCADGMNDLLTGQMPSTDSADMLGNLPHDFDPHPHSAFFDSTNHSFSFASGSDAAVGSCHHVTISSLGYVYQDSETEVGKVDNFNMYNTHGDRAGHVSADGVVYDAHDHKIGYVDASGLVHTPSGAVIYDAHGNMINGAAYMLLVYLGGVD